MDRVTIFVKQMVLLLDDDDLRFAMVLDFSSDTQAIYSQNENGDSLVQLILKPTSIYSLELAKKVTKKSMLTPFVMKVWFLTQTPCKLDFLT